MIASPFLALGLLLFLGVGTAAAHMLNSSSFNWWRTSYATPSPAPGRTTPA